MPIKLNTRWTGLPVRSERPRHGGLEQRAPEGACPHRVVRRGWGSAVTDIWQSADDFNRFVERPANAVVQEIGIQTGTLDLIITEMHAVGTRSRADRTG